MKSTIDIPDALLKEAKLRAIEESTTLRDIVIQSLQSYLFDEASQPATMKEDQATYGDRMQIDPGGWPLLKRGKGDDTVITDDLVNDMREEFEI